MSLSNLSRILLATITIAAIDSHYGTLSATAHSGASQRTMRMTRKERQDLLVACNFAGLTAEKLAQSYKRREEVTEDEREVLETYRTMLETCVVLITIDAAGEAIDGDWYEAIMDTIFPIEIGQVSTPEVTITSKSTEIPEAKRSWRYEEL